MSDMAMKYEDWLRGCVHHDGRKGNVYLPCDTVLAIADWIEAHRDVAPVRHGRWIECTSSPHWKCSMCGTKASIWFDEFDEICEWLSDYCPYCGARMDEGE